MMADDEQRPRTISDLTRPRHATQQTAIGPTRSCGDLDKKELFFLVSTILALLATLGLTIYRLTSVPAGSADFTFALVLIINTVACLIFVVHGLMRERPYEVAIFIIADVIVLIYCIVNYAEKPRWDDPTEHAVKLVRLILVVIFSVFCVPLAVYITVSFYQSRNLIFRTVGANAELQDMCDLTFFNEALLKLDFQLELSMVVLVLNKGTADVGTEDIVVLSVGTLFVLSWALLGYLAMRFENKVMVIIFLVLWWCEPAYIIYKMVDVAKLLHGQLTGEAALVPAAAIACGIAACLVHSLVLMVTWRVWSNFGKGLKEKVYGQTGTGDRSKVVEEETKT